MQDIFIIDDFYEDPFKVRDFARNINYNLSLPTEYYNNQGLTKWWPGLASPEYLKEHSIDIKISKILQIPVRASQKSGFFRLGKKDDTHDMIAHTDAIPDSSNKRVFQGVVYLSLPEHCDGKTGTVFYRHKSSGLVKLETTQQYWSLFQDCTNKDCWEVYHTIENKFNRLVLFDCLMLHGYGDMFGSTFEDGRLAQIFNFHEI